MGASIARRSSRHLIDSFAAGPIYSQRFTEVSVFSLLKDHLYQVIHLLVSLVEIDGMPGQQTLHNPD